MGDLFIPLSKAYLACGITTVLDVGAFPYVVNNVRKYLQEGHPGPRVLHLGPCLAPPGGYGGLFECPAATPDEVDMQLDKIQSLNTVGLKISFNIDIYVPAGVIFCKFGFEVQWNENVR